MAHLDLSIIQFYFIKRTFPVLWKLVDTIKTYCMISMSKQCVKVEFFQLWLDFTLKVALVKASTWSLVLAYAASNDHAAADP